MTMCILKIGIYEMIYAKDLIGFKILMNECIELSKKFAKESSSSLINAVLSNIARKNGFDAR